MKSSETSLTPEQRLAVVEQLHKEYQHLCWYYRVKLQRPVIVLCETSKTLGSWDAALRHLSIAERLVIDKPWDVVLEVFKHEMAHQYVSEHMQVADGHGRYFQAACDKLGVARWARRAEVDLESAIAKRHQVSQDPLTERLVRRAEKLIALTGSANEHESLLAMQRVRELFARHGLQRRQMGLEDDCLHRVIYFGKRRVERYQSMIGTILNDFFFVRVVYTSYYDVDSGKDLKAMDMMGSSAHVSMAEHVYHFLMGRLPELWKALRAQDAHMRGRRTKSSYYMGVLQGFHQKLSRQKLGDHTDTDTEELPVNSPSPISQTANQSLIVLDPETEQLVNAYVRQRFPRVQSQSYTRSRIDGRAFAAGKRDGNQIVIHRPIGNDSRKGPILRLR